MTTKTAARKELTIQQATREARRLVDKIMPGVGATVESRGSYDLKTDTPLIITRVTFPRDEYGANALALAAQDRLSADVMLADSSVTIRRAR